MLKITRKRTPCCRARWLWEVLAGMRIFRDVDGRKVYQARCESCRLPYDLDGGRA